MPKAALVFNFKFYVSTYIDRVFERIDRPVLLLQGNSSLDGMMTDRSVDNVMTKLDKGYHVLFEQAGHDLGLDSWEIGPLLKTVSAFLDTL